MEGLYIVIKLELFLGLSDVLILWVLKVAIAARTITSETGNEVGISYFISQSLVFTRHLMILDQLCPHSSWRHELLNLWFRCPLQ